MAVNQLRTGTAVCSQNLQQADGTDLTANHSVDCVTEYMDMLEPFPYILVTVTWALCCHSPQLIKQSTQERRPRSLGANSDVGLQCNNTALTNLTAIMSSALVLCLC